MFGAKTLARHADLVNRMAGTVGADFGTAVAVGRLGGEGLRGAVLRCTGCSRPEACAEWLALHPEGAEAPPSYCRNTELFAALKTDI